MANEQKPNPATEEETDVSKAQSAQQPAGQAAQQSNPSETAEEGTEQSGDQAATGQTQTGAGPDEGLQGETATGQRTEIEGTSQQQPEEASEAEGGFVGSQSDADSSSELVEDEDFAKGGQGAPEGK